MWLKHVKNNTYYPYTDILAKHVNMEVVLVNPFETKVEEELIEVIEEKPVVYNEEIKEKLLTPYKKVKAKVIPKKTIKAKKP